MLMIYSLYFALGSIALYIGFSSFIMIISLLMINIPINPSYPMEVILRMIVIVLILIPAGILLVFAWHGFIYSKKHTKKIAVVGSVLVLIYSLYYFFIYIEFYTNFDFRYIINSIPQISMLILSIILLKLTLKPRILNMIK